MEPGKLDYRKTDKRYYLPKTDPEVIIVPAFHFFALEGEGDPNTERFARHVETLYALSYTLKMLPKSGVFPEGYSDYAVYPLEGVWSLKSERRPDYSDLFLPIDKANLTYRIMIRQPDFLTSDLAQDILERTKKKKPKLPIENAEFEIYEEGRCVQMMHIGTYDEESRSFAKMAEFCESHGLVRRERTHREIYLSDPRKTPPERMKTVLRWRIL
ncbi:MAG TPA: GyrI-like domain-containing protein [Thermotogota bacterium]|jgi:hypothetical protein|nr:GyrI-like domain-containing protein [Thermotogota bacterium]NLH19436.1 hypothetical protein [Thermotogaceae bacterium]HNY81848.1 GyrI-like domain-containing protein [Thermotogota bacterium]HOD91630.1 GyrI-like domain-containing protein [Thermotogota bacterium]HOF22539.1 GyrI-like domain-containing protein [Thermotogota bacterium]